VSNCKGNLHFSLSGVQHYLSGSSIKMSEEAACVGTFYGNCVHKRDFPLVLQGKVAAHKLVVVGNTICFVANFLKHVTAKNYENWFTDKHKVIVNIKGYRFLKHSVHFSFTLLVGMPVNYDSSYYYNSLLLSLVRPISLPCRCPRSPRTCPISPRIPKWTLLGVKEMARNEKCRRIWSVRRCF